MIQGYPCTGILNHTILNILLIKIFQKILKTRLIAACTRQVINNDLGSCSGGLLPGGDLLTGQEHLVWRCR